VRTAIPLTMLATALACSLAAAPAHARARVFVASYGNDSNPCTFLSPCKTFQHAHDVVDAAGEVTAIDSGGFGPINITKAVTITSPTGVEAGIVPAASGDGIDINAAATDTVVLRGLTLQGTAQSAEGIIGSAGAIEIVDCVVRNFFDGIVLKTGTATMSVKISNTVVAANQQGGIVLGALQTGPAMFAALDQVTANNNLNGINLQASGGMVEALISNSHIDSNIHGIATEGASPTATANAVLKSVTMNENGVGIDIGDDSTVRMSQVTISAFVPGDVGINITGSNNIALSDNTNHIMGAINGTVQTWSPQ